MKFPFSLVALLFVFQLQARDVVLVHHSLNPQDRKLLEKVFRQDLGLPPQMTRFQFSRQPCRETSKALIHFCFSSLKQWKVLQRNQKVLENMILKIGNFEGPESQKAFNRRPVL